MDAFARNREINENGPGMKSFFYPGAEERMTEIEWWVEDTVMDCLDSNRILEERGASMINALPKNEDEARQQVAEILAFEYTDKFLDIIIEEYQHPTDQKVY